MSCIENKMSCIKKIKYLPLLLFLQCILTAYQFKLCVDGCVLAGVGRVIPPAPPALLKSVGKNSALLFQEMRKGSGVKSYIYEVPRAMEYLLITSKAKTHPTNSCRFASKYFRSIGIFSCSSK